MITISCRETLYTYNLYHLVKAFFPEEEVKQELHTEQEALAELRLEGGSCISVVEDMKNGQPVLRGCEAIYERNREKVDLQEKKRQVTRLVYEKLEEYTGKHLPWGMLTGVRPTKLAMRSLEKGNSEEITVRWMQEEYGVTRQKAQLAVKIAVREKKLLEPLNLREGYSLYVGIPFCPSICSYCSFSSFSAEAWKEQMDVYVDALCREIGAMGAMAAGKPMNTVYLGGGTPTTLSAKQLDRVLSQIENSFPHFGNSSFLEYTVEAGRPDSITREKLEVLRAHPVTRISVNPQTMQQRTLDLVGRRHTVQEVKDCFYLARDLGFENINMDLIAGLPGETAEDMTDTLRQIEELRPDSLTIHSLAIKRAARMGQEQRTLFHAGDSDREKKTEAEGSEGKKYLQPEFQDVEKSHLCDEISRMVESGSEAAVRMGLKPYYLYRQKNMAGNFENVGYAKVDKAGIYNILIMEEKQTILAAGAGAMTKLVLPEAVRTENGKETNLVRMENVKNVREYISRIEEMIQKKTRAWQENMKT